MEDWGIGGLIRTIKNPPMAKNSDYQLSTYRQNDYDIGIEIAEAGEDIGRPRFEF